MIAEFFVPGEEFEAGIVRQKIEAAGHSLNLAPLQLEQIQAALLRATLNALEYNQHTLGGARVPICIRVSLQDLSESYDLSNPDSSRSWGYFIVNQLIDSQASQESQTHHTIEIFLYPEGQI